MVRPKLEVVEDMTFTDAEIDAFLTTALTLFACISRARARRGSDRSARPALAARRLLADVAAFFSERWSSGDRRRC